MSPTCIARPAVALVALACLLALAGCGEDADPNAKTPQEVTPTQTLTFDVEGMTCQGCVNKIESSVAQLPGVASVEVSLDEKRATVACDETCTPDAVVAAVEGAGYQAKPAVAVSP